MFAFDAHIFQSSLFWFLMAVFFAVLDIEFEERGRWREAVAGRIRNRKVFSIALGLVLAGRPLIAYHMMMFFLPILIFHARFIMGHSWSLSAELVTIALYFAWMPVWDYVRRLLQPHNEQKDSKDRDRARKFGNHWLFEFNPLDYVWGWLISLLVAALADRIAGTNVFIWNQIDLLIWFIIFIAITIVAVTPLYKHLHKKLRHGDSHPIADM